MSKFKVGDKVRIVKNGPYSLYAIGTEFIVNQVKNNTAGEYVIGKTVEGGVYSKYLELVPRFKIGDRVRIKDASEEDTYHGSYKVGDEFVITRLDDFSTGFAEGNGFEGGVWFKHLELVPAEPELKKGDRVKVEYEGTVYHVKDKEVIVQRDGTGDIHYHAPSELTKIKPSIPTNKGAVILISGWVYQNIDEGQSKYPWYRAGTDYGKTVDHVQSEADKYGFTVLHEGNKDA